MIDVHGFRAHHKCYSLVARVKEVKSTARDAIRCPYCVEGGDFSDGSSRGRRMVSLSQVRPRQHAQPSFLPLQLHQMRGPCLRQLLLQEH